MAKKVVKKSEDKFLAIDGDDYVVAKGQTIQEIIDDLREQHREKYYHDSDQSLSDYIDNENIQIFEVKSALQVEEKITRTIYINGEIASL